ncbi:MAG: hypothetical protein NTW85_08475 [Methylococcales bacterium]|nr:hypothetical protein [Methylococcales bacterium]
MDVIIVAKTHMSNSACVGGILVSGRFVRLLDSNGHNQSLDTELNIGDVCSITFTERPKKKPPHIEDILVSTIVFKYSVPSIDKMIEFLKKNIKITIWSGNTDVLFDGKLQWTNSGSGYISESGEMPDSSVGFWIPDKDLTQRDYQGKVKYSYPIRWRNIPFVGFQSPVDIIPAGTLVRVSLARWWSPNEDEKRCYLQLSGWYGLHL